MLMVSVPPSHIADKFYSIQFSFDLQSIMLSRKSTPYITKQLIRKSIYCVTVINHQSLSIIGVNYIIILLLQ